MREKKFEEGNGMTNKKLLEDLKNGSNLRIRRFKNHDRLYWTSTSGKLNIQGNLKCKIKTWGIKN